MAVNNGQQTNQADAWLNVKLVGADGVEYSLPRNGIPLNITSRAGRSLITKAKADKDFTVSLIGTVQIQGDVNEVDIPL